MIQIIHDNDGVHSIRLHETTYSPQALAQMVVMAERYRVALEKIARCETIDPVAFAAGVCGGATVQAALEADEALLESSALELDKSLLRMGARSAVVRAALALEQAEQAALEATYPPVAYPAWREAEQALYAACRAYRALGGVEL